MVTDEQVRELKEKNVKYRKQIKELKEKLGELQARLDLRIRLYEGSDRATMDPKRFAEMEALKKIEHNWPKLARALAVYINPYSYDIMRNALPEIASGYNGGTPETAYNKLLGLMKSELWQLDRAVKHRYNENNRR